MFNPDINKYVYRSSTGRYYYNTEEFTAEEISDIENLLVGTDDPAKLALWAENLLNILDNYDN